jgi:hypothetical protein
LKIYFSVRAYRTTSLRLPAGWLFIAAWLSAICPSFPTPEPEQLTLKNPETPLLRSSSVSPPDSVLRTFPSRASAQAETRVNVENFRHYIDLALPFWPFSKSVRAISALNQISEGARPILTHSLQSLFAPNMSSAYQYGSSITDNIVSWIKNVMSAALLIVLHSLFSELTPFRQYYNMTKSGQF